MASQIFPKVKSESSESGGSESGADEKGGNNDSFEYLGGFIIWVLIQLGMNIVTLGSCTYVASTWKCTKETPMKILAL